MFEYLVSRKNRKITRPRGENRRRTQFLVDDRIRRPVPHDASLREQRRQRLQLVFPGREPLLVQLPYEAHVLEFGQRDLVTHVPAHAGVARVQPLQVVDRVQLQVLVDHGDALVSELGWSEVCVKEEPS